MKPFFIDWRKSITGNFRWRLIEVHWTFADDRVEVRNLMDNNVMVLNGRVHLTSSTSMSQLTEATFEEYHCRILIEKLTNAIPKKSPDTSKLNRIDFCETDLRLILKDCRDGNFNLLMSRTTELHNKYQSIISNSVNFKLIVYEVYYRMQRKTYDLMNLNKENKESLSIAAKIFQDKCETPFEMPRQTTTTTTITVSICCVCNKMHRRTDVRKCQRCANVYHNKCHRRQTECPQCLDGNALIDVVLIKLKKWWPAFIIHNHQVPKEIYQKRRNQPGSVFVFTIGNNDYEQVHTSNLLTFRNDDALQKKLLDKNMEKDPNLFNAVELAKKLNSGMRSSQELDSWQQSIRLKITIKMLRTFKEKNLSPFLFWETLIIFLLF